MIRRLLLLSLTLIPFSRLKAQDSLNSGPKQKLYQFVEYPAYFRGGDAAMYAFISQNLHYPDSAVKAGIEGTVKVCFIVKRNGHIGDVGVEQSAGYGMDEEALRVVQMMPRWHPCRVNGVKVNATYRIPISFRLNKG